MVVELEGDAGCLLEWTLNDNDVIDLGLKSLEDDIEFPTASRALVYDEFCTGLEGSQWLEAHLEYKGILGAQQSLIFLLKED
jgi:hypothetical protein